MSQSSHTVSPANALTEEVLARPPPSRNTPKVEILRGCASCSWGRELVRVPQFSQLIGQTVVHHLRRPQAGGSAHLSPRNGGLFLRQEAFVCHV